MEKVIITAAVVGAEITKEDTPYLPTTPDEIAIDVEKAAKAGAAIVHLHVRDKEGRPTQDKKIFEETIKKIRERVDIIIQVSTGGAVGMTPEERIQPVTLNPEMATLTTGTVNFGDEVFLNKPEDIRSFAKELKKYGVRAEFEIFDVGMIFNAMRLVNEGLVEGHLHFDFVMGVPGGIPATAKHLLHLIDHLPKGATWSVAGIGRHQLPMAMLALPLGGHVRVGLEDNIYYKKGVLAKSNSELVARVVRLAEELGREVATPKEARKILGLTSD
ncbi:3-keto-5-aminohexanoate cleavage protein [Vulcanibacillus modesticaldus]|uniref:3-keto-5-aminohexanoate cleavage protein n=1 Tax=Vulcanibacillus modesticaldus TaxID=337097 RepID=A0A1D2YSH4_9BACI|nr:3-keto-5-aminohexanoate cleavage protein [Vulcanibacillus modesticaldus]OEF97264.1 3-keto-5-aminohexanoate cleavage protein [Vulcanibacillus modesticaldus]